MGLISLLFRDPRIFICLAILLLYSVIIHEISHGWMAYLFGDDTAKRLGRLSLNPAKHLDPIGTAALFFVGFGWAKPVPVNYANLRNLRLGLIFVSLAGCLANFFIATIVVFLLKSYSFNEGNFVYITLLNVAKINVVLGSFNLIPIPPLDGSKILMGFLPMNAQYSLAKLEPYGFFILIILIVTGVLEPVINFMGNLIFIIISILLR